MPYVYTFSATDDSYPTWDTYLPHKRRAHNKTYFTGMTVFTEQTQRIQKGMGVFLEAFFCAKNHGTLNWPTSWPYPNPLYYNRLEAAQYQIKPDTFIDCRPDYALEQATSLGFIPGLDPESYLGEWPMWTPSVAYGRHRRVHMTNGPETIEAMYKVALHWHITTPAGMRPRSKVEAASGLIEAIGAKWLRHPLLENIEYRQSVYEYYKKMRNE